MPFGRKEKSRTDMSGYHTVRCLFCVTGKEESVAHTVHRNGWGRAIFAKRAALVRTNGQWTEISKPLLPGYVFVYSDEKQVQVHQLEAINHVIRVLSYESGHDELTEQDLKFADWIWCNDGWINPMKAVQVGDWIEITDGIFKQLHGTIVRMDRRKRNFLVSLDGAGVLRQIWMTYEIVDKKDVVPNE